MNTFGGDFFSVITIVGYVSANVIAYLTRIGIVYNSYILPIFRRKNNVISLFVAKNSVWSRQFSKSSYIKKCFNKLGAVGFSSDYLEHSNRLILSGCRSGRCKLNLRLKNGNMVFKIIGKRNIGSNSRSIGSFVIHAEIFAAVCICHNILLG